MSYNIIDLDKFATEYEVTINGKQYPIRQMSVQEVIEASKAKTPKDQDAALKQNIETIQLCADIPTEVLRTLPPQKLAALIGIVSGGIRTTDELSVYFKIPEDKKSSKK